MIEFVPLDPEIHRDQFIQLNVEHVSWMVQQLKEKYQLDALSLVEQTIPEYVEEHLDDLIGLKPPDGIVFLLVVDGDVAGMGALRKLRDVIGEIKRMYIRPTYRGRGYGKQLLNKLLESGRKFGCTSFWLETGKFMAVAQHIYRSAGFQEMEEYAETEVPPLFRPYWLFMEKKE